MNLSSNNPSVPTDHLLTCLNLAIEEARLSRSLIEPKKHDSIYSVRLHKLNKEIDYLEAKRLQIRATSRMMDLQ